MVSGPIFEFLGGFKAFLAKPGESIIVVVVVHARIVPHSNKPRWDRAGHLPPWLQIGYRNRQGSRGLVRLLSRRPPLDFQEVSENNSEHIRCEYFISLCSLQSRSRCPGAIGNSKDSRWMIRY